MPPHGFEPVMVPGAPSAWAECSRKFGRLPLSEVLAPAIDYAENGFPISPVLGRFWKRAYRTFTERLTHPMFKHWFDTFGSKQAEGQAPEIGEMWASKDHAATLRAIAETGADAFYKGELADKIDAFSRKHDGFIRKEDLEAYQPEWVEPISVNYRGYDVWEIPPNGQGLITLMALNVLKGYEFSDSEAMETRHKQIEALKLAFSDGQKYITDHSHMTQTIEAMLSEGYAEERRSLIGTEARQPEPGEPPKGGTVYLATADSEGNMVSFIQSNYMGFGSGLVVPGTGIALQNRGHNFSMDENHDNCIAPGKKTYHTIIPGFLTKNNQPVGPFGVMGGFMQPQGHLQVVMNTVDFHLNPQAALDAPRWQWIKDKTVEVESTFPHHTAQGLSDKGHDVKIALEPNSFGRGQIIWRDPETGVLTGGSETRTDGTVAVW